MKQASLVLGGGCFWCLEAVYVRVKGVLDVESGYANGDATRWPQPSYEQVCAGVTGYNEVVKLIHDPDVVSTRELLEVFFTIHDPTTVNRQGNDVGTQYRSGIYTHTPEQVEVSTDVLREVQSQYTTRVVTELEPVRHYCPAETYHQDYFARHPNQGYCAFVVAPKVAKFQTTFRRLMA
jgi:peptide-methionine (S)-S-oxide reductase